MVKGNRISIFILLAALIILSACQKPTPEVVVVTATQPEPTQTTAPTETPLPTATIELPTITTTVESSPASDGLIFRDDFSGSISSDLFWKNERKNKWSLTDDGFLQIVGTNALLVSSGEQDNMLCMQLPEGDFAASTHVIAAPTANFQQAAIFIYEDGDNFVAINRGYCDLAACETGGNAFYMDYKVNGVFGAYKLAAQETDVYLKLEKVDTILSGYYAVKEGEWQRLGRFGDLFDLKEVCIGAGNGADVNSDIVAQFDYFEITKP